MNANKSRRGFVWPLVNDELKKIVGKVLSGTTDINSVLREAEEAANKAIADEKTR